MLRLLIGLILCGFSYSSQTEVLDAPKPLQDAARFVWYVASEVVHPDELNSYDDVEVNLSDSSLNEMEGLIRSLVRVRHELRPEVALIFQRMISRRDSEQILIYRIFVNRQGSRFIRLKTMGGEKSTLIVTEFQALSPDEAFNFLVEGRSLSFPQSR